MFESLNAISPAAITAARRGSAVETFYANIIGTVAVKYALNAGAKNLLAQTIAATQTRSSSGRQRNPAEGTLKFDLFSALRELQSIPATRLPSRDITKTHEERSALAGAFAEGLVKAFRALRERRLRERSPL